MDRILVFCGSNHGSDDRFTEQTIRLGKTLAKQNIELVYGGAKVGLMGKLADAVLDAGGKVTGVIPRFLKEKEILHEKLTAVILVDTLQERKAKMSALCDGVIALPGGYGTLDELFEMLTRAQLGLHFKPIGMLNVAGYYDPLLMMIEKMATSQFLKKSHADRLLVEDNVDALLNRMLEFTAPTDSKWMDR